MGNAGQSQLAGLGRVLALVAGAAIAAGVLVGGAQPAKAQPVPGQPCSVGGQSGVYVCPAGTVQVGNLCDTGVIFVAPVCQATGPSLAKQATVATKISTPKMDLLLFSELARNRVFSGDTEKIFINVRDIYSFNNAIRQLSFLKERADKFIAILQRELNSLKLLQENLPQMIEEAKKKIQAKEKQAPRWRSGQINEAYYRKYILPLKEKLQALENRKESIENDIAWFSQELDNSIPIRDKITTMIETAKAARKKFEMTLQTFQSKTSAAPTRLGMDIGPAKFDVFAIGDGAVANGNGFGVRDATGVIQPGTLTPNSRSTIAGVGIRGSVDASRWLNLDGDQSLVANGFVSYSRVDSKSGNTAALAALGLTNTGTARADNVTFGGDVRYDFAEIYVEGAGAFNLARQSTSNTIDGSQASFDSRWYNVDLRLGKILMLGFGTFGPLVSPGLVGKEKPVPFGAYIIGLDLSGHVGHTNLQTDAFTDSTGFVYGTSQTRYEAVGGRAELYATVINGNILWKPYVAMKIDQRFDFSSSAYFPAQPDLPTGNVVYYTPANTFWGPELGLTIAAPAWWSVQARGFYLASADANVAGGSLQVRIPFNP